MIIQTDPYVDSCNKGEWWLGMALLGVSNVYCMRVLILHFLPSWLQLLTYYYYICIIYNPPLLEVIRFLLQRLAILIPDLIKPDYTKQKSFVTIY